MKMAFTNTIENGVQVWILDLETATAKRVTEAFVNANMGNPISWFKDGKSLLVNMLPATRKELINTAEAVPTGPTISTSDGSKAQTISQLDIIRNQANFQDLFSRISTDTSHGNIQIRNQKTSLFHISK